MNRNIEEQLETEGFYVSTTVGWSMFPMLRNRRDRVVIRPIGEKRLKRFDLPLYRRPDGKYILHRVIGVRDGHYIIRGDNTYRKEYVPAEWILGYVDEFYRNGKHKTVQGKGYRFYVRLWNLLYPLRFLVFHGLLFFYRIRKKIFPNKKKTPSA
ncbi:MAG: S24/S26 family peptidase [Clostridia bacterium]|nr:S24/S26 family peptidase [Clostridia bacterium]